MPDFNKAKQAAAELLSSQSKKLSLAVDASSLRFQKNIVIESFENYSIYAELSFEQQCELYDKLHHGCALQVGMISLILYDNKERNKRRLNWSVAHELGHIHLDHDGSSDCEEIEANFFASQLLTPDAIVRELQTNGVQLTAQLLQDTFYLSREAALKKLDYIKRGCHLYEGPFDDLITAVFQSGLNLCISFQQKPVRQQLRR